MILEKLGRVAPRERGVVFSGSHVIGKHVIASEAKQSIVTAHAERWIASAFARRATADKSLRSQ
jgi:hypothetical protein